MIERFIISVLFIAVTTACAVGEDDTASAVENADSTYVLGELNYQLLPEASGMAVSQFDSNRIWFVNDQGNAAELIAVDTSDMSHHVARVTKAKNKDWEDLAAFSIDNQAWLVVADVGDNKSVRDNVRLVFVEEPNELSANSKLKGHIVRITYPDGARDVEAIAVDVARDSIYLLSKRTKPPVLYRVALREALQQAHSGTKAQMRAQEIGTVTSIPTPTALELKLFPKYGEFRNQPTAMDISRDGQWLALLTYGEAYLISMAPHDNWLAAMNGTLQRLNMPILAQPETIAFGPDNAIYITSERERAPLLRIAPNPAMLSP